MHGRIVDLWRYRATSEEENFIEQIKASIFLDELLAIEIMQEPLSNFEVKVNPSILKDQFYSRRDLFIFASTAPVLFDWSNETS